MQFLQLLAFYHEELQQSSDVTGHHSESLHVSKTASLSWNLSSCQINEALDLALGYMPSITTH